MPVKVNSVCVMLKVSDSVCCLGSLLSDSCSLMGSIATNSTVFLPFLFIKTSQCNSQFALSQLIYECYKYLVHVQFRRIVMSTVFSLYSIRHGHKCTALCLSFAIIFYPLHYSCQKQGNYQLKFFTSVWIIGQQLHVKLFIFLSLIILFLLSFIRCSCMLYIKKVKHFNMTAKP